MYDCLDNLIGITRSDCNCVINGLSNGTLPADWYKQSTSGLFLDELEGIVPLIAAGQSGECDSDMATFYNTARNSAIQMMSDEVMIGITQRAVNGQKTYNGKIAGVSYSSPLLVGTNYAGLKLFTVPMKGGTITINKIYAMMNADAAFNILVYKIERGATEYELVTTISGILSQANALKENILETPVTLDLSLYGCDYYLLYQPAGFAPRQNNLSCGCGNKEYIMRNYLQVNGVAGNDIPMLPYFMTYTNGMGLALDASVGCDTTKIICEAYTNDEASKLVMSYAARYKAGELLHEYVLRSDNVNRYTMSSRESLYGKRNHFKSEYDARINWLVANIDLALIDCYICNDKRVTKGGILV